MVLLDDTRSILERYGIQLPNGLSLIQLGKRVYLVGKDVFRLIERSKIKFESIGIPLSKDTGLDVKLSTDGLQFLSRYTPEDSVVWVDLDAGYRFIQGGVITVETDEEFKGQRYVIVGVKVDGESLVLGCGLAHAKNGRLVILSQVPKERRLHEVQK